MHAAPAWYASAIRRIASGLASFADAIDRLAPDPLPLEPAPRHHRSDDRLLDARYRAQFGP